MFKYLRILQKFDPSVRQALRDQARVLNSEPIVPEPILEFQKNCEKY